MSKQTSESLFNLAFVLSIVLMITVLNLFVKAYSWLMQNAILLRSAGAELPTSLKLRGTGRKDRSFDSESLRLDERLRIRSPLRREASESKARRARDYDRQLEHTGEAVGADSAGPYTPKASGKTEEKAPSSRSHIVTD